VVQIVNQILGILQAHVESNEVVAGRAFPSPQREEWHRQSWVFFRTAVPRSTA
jgi:hypothetical protein